MCVERCRLFPTKRIKSLGHDAPRNARPTPEYVEAVDVAFFRVEKISLRGYLARAGPAMCTWRLTNSMMVLVGLTPHIAGSRAPGGQVPWPALHSAGRVSVSRKNEVRGRRALKEAGSGWMNRHLRLLHTPSEGTKHAKSNAMQSRMLMSSEACERQAPSVA
jgi:hypothetical protein